MTRKEAIAKRSRLKELLAKYEARTITHCNETERGLLGNHSDGPRCAVLRTQIAELDRQIPELPRT
jgi:hypothetical protein